MTKRVPPVEKDVKLISKPVVVHGLLVRFEWWHCSAGTVGLVLLHDTAVIAYLIVQRDQLPYTATIMQALDTCPWVEVPPLGWDILPIQRVGQVHCISRQEAATPKTKVIRRRSRTK